MQNALTKHVAALALTLGLLLTGTPARAEPIGVGVRPGLFNAAGSAMLSPLRHTCGAKQGG